MQSRYVHNNRSDPLGEKKCDTGFLTYVHDLRFIRDPMSSMLNY